MAGGKIIRRTLNKSYTEVDGNFDGFYENLSMNAGDNNIYTAKTTNHGNPKKEPNIGKHFVKGWWTNHRNEPIKRAIYGQVLRFHIEMDKIYTKSGDIVYFAMFDSDMRTFGNDVVKADDAIGLVYKDGSGKPYTWEKVDTENKVVIEFSTTDSLEQWTTALDEDKIFELYFRCSYVNHGNVEHKELPYNFHDYLNLGSIVIDRYKMPGLKADGSDIADDMTYGTGHPYKSNIYSDAEITQFKNDYKLFGFDPYIHSKFANKNIEPTILEEVIVIGKAKSKQPEPEILNLPQTIPADNTGVVLQKFPSLAEMMEIKKRLNEKNEKAIYSEKQCYSTIYKPEFKIPHTKFKIKLPPISTGFDIRIFDNLTDEQLFWNFKNTAEIYFARGELEGNLNRMIAQFRRNQGGIYEDEILTEKIVQHPNTTEYCQKVEDYIAEKLKTKFSKLEDVEDKESYFLINEDYQSIKKKRDKEFSKPSYSYDNPIEATKGLTIALNDIWSAEVILKEVTLNEDDYTVKYQVTLWDHFGLDLPDMEKKFNIIPSLGEVFVCWFILQHLRGFKPFITKITFIKEFIGNLNKGITELKSEREEKRQKDAYEWAEQERQKMWREPKF